MKRTAKIQASFSLPLVLREKIIIIKGSIHINTIMLIKENPKLPMLNYLVLNKFDNFKCNLAA